ncbi:2-phospho-L-lactate guanylyltransferase [Paracraurococcus lichenis]|uniref:3-phospho-D-glycerate guanylyltransferase n=1 Tax=Paracraurococcus lichenis TaxID=3064888 RepID=A0ABT9DZE2_9PROT|nr:2-phospho-L-lactate guanylyltransferase [Paracraurococcus sp. LOR1-02]MDO9709249.1 2-phospho-L-lactate guanylyltransferase [Paracraurococcus sp. LOR1-02]
MSIWAILPVKEMQGSKQRLSPLLAPEERVALMRVMAGEVLDALCAARGLAGVAVVTLDDWTTAEVRRRGARVITEGARDGHTGSVTAAARVLATEGAAGVLTMPGDIPAVTPAEVEALLAAHGPPPAFTIAPAHDEKGSNGVILSPPDAVPLRFGDDSYFPHLAAARAQGIAPRIVPLPGVAMDIDHPADVAMFAGLEVARGTRTLAWLQQSGVLGRLSPEG